MRHPSRAIAALVALSLPAVSGSAEPLHQRIDQLIAAGHKDYAKQAAPLASDAEFLRRVTLDLNGTIPTAAEARAFLADKDADKRTKLIDKLLAGPGYARRLTHFFDAMLMERRADVKVARAKWEDFLRINFEQNRPYDELVKEMLAADGVDVEKRGPAKFFLERDFEPNLVTRDLGRLFLGRNMQCAQCHDSPIVDEYKQEHYYGIMAFINRSALFPNARANNAAIGEKADGEVTFISVFDKNKVQKTTGPKVIAGKTIADQKVEKGKEYKVAPTAATVRPVPTFSRRELLPAAIVESPYFRRNIANRMWAMLMGRGIVHPLDLDHKDNPPSHPELLDLLGDELAAHKYDLKWLIRELALSKTYQRSSETPANLKDPPVDRFLVATLKPLSPEQLAYAVMQASGFTDAERSALGPKATDAALNPKLAAQVPTFVKMFGSGAGQPEDFQANLDQTLFLKHSAALRNLFAQRRNDCLIDRAGKIEEMNALADELFMSVFTRPATADEKKDVAAFMKDAKDKYAELSEVIWAMLASAEFRFNH